MEWLELKFRRSEGAVEADQNKSRPPWERAAPAAQNTLTLGCLPPLALGHRYCCAAALVQPTSGRSWGYALPGGKRVAPSEAVISSHLWRFGARNWIHQRQMLEPNF